MSWFQLDPPSIVTRARAAGTTANVPSLAASVWRGLIGFTIVSVAGFVPWAVFGRFFRQHGGEVGMYIACALVFLVLSGLLLHRLIIGPGSLGRFYKLFSIAFTAYSVAWIVGWMMLRGHAGSVAGLFAGTVFMGAILAAAFDATNQAIKVILSLFILNSLGYFIGGELEAAFIHHHAIAAKLLWGVAYGIGLGAGLGLAFYVCQAKARALLAVTPVDS